MPRMDDNEMFTTEYRRYVALADVPVTGRFRFGESFQIYPAPPNAPTTDYINGTHPFLIEISYQAANQPVRNEEGHYLHEPWAENQIRALEKLTEVLITLSGLTIYRLHIPKSKGAWYRPLNHRETGKLPMPQWGQQGYILPDIGPYIAGFTELDGAELTMVEARQYYGALGRQFDQVLEFPDNLAMNLERVESLTPKARQAFLSACSLFDQGSEFWQHHPSLSFASYVSAIEALIEYEYRKVKRNKCGECGQFKFAVTDKFREFCQKYCLVPYDLEPVISKIYRYRSKILHAGKLMLGDLIMPRIGTWDNADERDTHQALIKIFQICLVNWLAAHSLKVQL